MIVDCAQRNRERDQSTDHPHCPFNERYLMAYRIKLRAMRGDIGNKPIRFCPDFSYKLVQFHNGLKREAIIRHWRRLRRRYVRELCRWLRI